MSGEDLENITPSGALENTERQQSLLVCHIPALAVAASFSKLPAALVRVAVFTASVTCLDVNPSFRQSQGKLAQPLVKVQSEKGLLRDR